MVPFESLGTVSYSHFTAMAVSLAVTVCEIIQRHTALWVVQGH